MKCISFGKFDKKLLIPIVAGLIRLGYKYILKSNPKYEILSQNPFLYNIYINTGMILAFIPYLIIKYRIKNSSDNSKKLINLSKLLNKARRAFVPLYIAEELTAKEDNGNKRSLFGFSIKQWKTTKLVSSVIISLVISVLLAFVVPGAKVMNKEDTIIMVFQMLIMAASACAFYFSAVNFICNGWREDLSKKVRIMEEYYRANIGTITYENDRELPDGSRILGKKLFTPSESKQENKSIGYSYLSKTYVEEAPIREHTESEDEREKKEGEEWGNNNSVTNNATSASNI